MAQYPQLTKAPIAEAVVEFHLERAGEYSVDAFARWALKKYPRMVQPGATDDSRKDASLFKSVANDLAIRVTTEGFSFHVLAQYQGWKTHRPQAREAWDALVEHMAPASVDRVGLRYINLFELKSELPVSDQLRVIPSFPDEIASTYHEFMIRVAVPLGGERHGIIHQALGPPKDGSGSALLDIETFTTEKFALSSGSDALWKEIDVLHDLVSRCFFESLQAPLLERFT